MHGLFSSRHPARQQRCHYRSRGRHFRCGECAAAVRANTAARILLGLPVSANNLATAARMCGSNIACVADAVTLIESEDTSLETSVRRGQMTLPRAAAAAKKRAVLICAYRDATPADLAALARAIGPAAIFDAVVVPALN